MQILTASTRLATLSQALTEALQTSGIVMFPTETFYGLGVAPYDLEAVNRLVALKGGRLRTLESEITAPNPALPELREGGGAAKSAEAQPGPSLSALQAGEALTTTATSALEAPPRFALSSRRSPPPAALKPFPLLAASFAVCEELLVLPDVLKMLCKIFWPGPLTVILPPRNANEWPKAILGSNYQALANGAANRTEVWPVEVLGGIGVRLAVHPVACLLSRLAGGLITATSANLAGEAPLKAVADMPAALARELAVVVDGGEIQNYSGLPSTVVGLGYLPHKGREVIVLRSGAIALEQLAEVLGYEPLVLASKT